MCIYNRYICNVYIINTVYMHIYIYVIKLSQIARYL